MYITSQSFSLLVFSSCVIAELFTDGRPLFDLSQLLEYFSGEYSPDVTLKRIADKHIRVGFPELLHVHRVAYPSVHEN